MIIKDILNGTFLQLLFLLYLVCADRHDVSNDKQLKVIFEDTTSKLFSIGAEVDFFSKVKSLKIMQLLPGCGRMKNRIAVFSDGTKACCKYNENLHEQQGEVYTYHLNKAMGVWSVPPTMLVKLNLTNFQWKEVVSESRQAGWRNGHTIVMTLFIDNLQHEYIPHVFTNFSNTVFYDTHLNRSQQHQIFQWSDMIVLDYLTGNTDRLFCNLLNMQWSPSVLHKPIHNLGKTTSGSLVLYDNESAFFIGYAAVKHYNKQLSTHFIDKLCIFRSSIVDKISKHLIGSIDLLSETEKLFRDSNPVGFRTVKELGQGVDNEFQLRVKVAADQIDSCLADI